MRLRFSRMGLIIILYGKRTTYRRCEKASREYENMRYDDAMRSAKIYGRKVKFASAIIRS